MQCGRLTPLMTPLTLYFMGLTLFALSDANIDPHVFGIIKRLGIDSHWLSNVPVEILAPTLRRKQMRQECPSFGLCR